ncbi:Arf8p [Stylosanthes scabra]|uniref:Arf8p n=1 Tax=Stylosanthes scabra TaxID=79078 RepID=A0ABU6SHD8_9FABA|nr:Arf8p [Stylosanthes scabra]
MQVDDPTIITVIELTVAVAVAVTAAATFPLVSSSHLLPPWWRSVIISITEVAIATTSVRVRFWFSPSLPHYRRRNLKAQELQYILTFQLEKKRCSSIPWDDHWLGVEKKCLDYELWHACAGPLVSLPTAGTSVVYFPQDHSEQVAATINREVDGHI